MLDITVNDAQGLPDKAYLSVRVGEVRRQMQFKPGSRFRFDGDAPRYFVVDVFEKIGTQQVSLAELGVVDGGDKEGSIQVVRTDGQRANLSLKVALPGSKAGDVPIQNGQNDAFSDAKTIEDTKKTIRHQAAVKAKNYLDEHAVQKLLQAMVHTLLEKQPEDPVEFMQSYLQGRADTHAKKSAGAAPEALVEESRRNKSPPPKLQLPLAASQPCPSRPGLGNDETPGFEIDGSSSLPDLKSHFSTVATILREDPSLYTRCLGVTTPLGVTLAKCIKTGIDNAGHQMIRTTGIVAGDEHCYQTFVDVFEPIIGKWHNGYARTARHPTNLKLSEVHGTPLDVSGGHVMSVEVRLSRNVKGLRMPTACSLDERREAERVLVKALLSMQDPDLNGNYLSHRGSSSYIPRPSGMSEDEEDQLRKDGVFFEEPDAAVLLASGYGRHWPDARGVFRSQKPGLFASINETDHLKLVSRRNDGDLRRAFERVVEAQAAVEASLRKGGYGYASNDHLGFLTTCVTQLGTAMYAGAVLRIPLLSAHPQFQDLVGALGLTASMHVDFSRSLKARGAFWSVSGAHRLGVSEVEQINSVLEGCRIMSDFETRLESGEEFDLVEEYGDEVAPVDDNEEFDAWFAETGGKRPRGLGDLDVPGFPVDACPESLPDLSEHHSMMADVMKRDSSIYDRLRSKRTVGGVTLARCIKTGIDTPGHPLIRTIGMVAGDADCYDVFQDLFDPVIAEKHAARRGQDVLQSPHRTDLDPFKVTSEPLDPVGEHVVAVQVRMSRNFRHLRFPSACSLEERREVERITTTALTALTGELEGDYLPITGSNSYVSRPGGMTDVDALALKQDGFLFDEPDSEVTLTSGLGRHWPDARGVFVSTSRRFCAMVNEEDHLRLVSVEPGHHLKRAFQRLCWALRSMEDEFNAAGFPFAHSGRLGFLGTNLSSLGTCLTASATVRLRRLPGLPGFSSLCNNWGVQARARRPGSTIAGSSQPKIRSADGLLDITNIERLGSSEVDQVNTVATAVRKLVELERRLANGEELDLTKEA